MFSRVAIIFALLLTSCAGRVSQENVTPVQPSPQLIAPDYGWKNYFLPEIVKRARIAKLAKLNNAKLSTNDLEVRIWYGFGTTALEGFVIKRTAGQWSALHLAGIPLRPHANYDVVLATPNSGWDACWRRLTDAGIFTLPDASQLGKEPIDPDVLSYVVECNDGGNYRAYHYTYPEASDHKEAKQMVNIGEIIYEEFGLRQFRAI